MYIIVFLIVNAFPVLRRYYRSRKFYFIKKAEKDAQKKMVSGACPNLGTDLKHFVRTAQYNWRNLCHIVKVGTCPSTSHARAPIAGVASHMGKYTISHCVYRIVL